MSESARVVLPAEFGEVLPIANARERFAEAMEVAERVLAAGVPLRRNPDHAAIFTDPPRRVADFDSEVLTLGVMLAEGDVVLVQPERDVPPGSRIL